MNHSKRKNSAIMRVLLCKTRLQSVVHHRIYPLFIFDLDLGVTQNIAEYPPHHVTYAPVKFEVAMSNG